MGVVIAAIVIHFKPEYTIADPICTLVFAVIVMTITIPLVKGAFLIQDATMIIMEATPKDFDIKAFKLELEEVKGVKDVHGNIIIIIKQYKIH